MLIGSMPMRGNDVTDWKLEPHREQAGLGRVAPQDNHLSAGRKRCRCRLPHDLIRAEDEVMLAECGGTTDQYEADARGR
jgi:hypothetical protein